MNEWMPPTRAWHDYRRLGAMVVLVVAAWLGAGWPWINAWPALMAVLLLAIGMGHALVGSVAALLRRRRWRAAVEGVLCVLFAASTWVAFIAFEAAGHAANPC